MNQHVWPLLLPAVATGGVLPAVAYAAVVVAAAAAYAGLRAQSPSRAAAWASVAALVVSLVTTWMLP